MSRFYSNKNENKRKRDGSRPDFQSRGGSRGGAAQVHGERGRGENVKRLKPNASAQVASAGEQTTYDAAALRAAIFEAAVERHRAGGGASNSAAAKRLAQFKTKQALLGKLDDVYEGDSPIGLATMDIAQLERLLKKKKSERMSKKKKSRR